MKSNHGMFFVLGFTLVVLVFVPGCTKRTILWDPVLVVSGLSPQVGPTGGGTEVRIFGLRFRSGSEVYFGTSQASSVFIESPEQIVCTLPAGTAGSTHVTVISPLGERAVLNDAFTYDVPPDLTSITPNTGFMSGGSQVALAGTDFASGAAVTIGGRACSGYDYTGVPTAILCSIPPGSPGTEDVAIVNPIGLSDTLAGAFTYLRDDMVLLGSVPFDGETDVYINDPIVMTFSSPVDASTVSTTTVWIADSTGAVPSGTLQVSGTEIRFYPDDPPGLVPLETYTVTLQGEPLSPVLKNQAGVSLGESVTFSFTTGIGARPDGTPPSIVSCNIADLETDVARDVNIRITFSEPLDSTTVSSSFLLTDLDNNETIPGTLTLTDKQAVLNFDPENNTGTNVFPFYLDASTNYEIRLLAGIKDLAGLDFIDPISPPAYPPWVLTFTTGTTPSAASWHGPFLDDFSTSDNEDTANTNAEWNTTVSQAVVSRVFATPTRVDFPGPAGNPVALAEPFSGSTGWRVASLHTPSEIAAVLGAPVTQLAGLPLTRLYAQYSGAFAQATYTDVTIRIGMTTATAFSQTATTFTELYNQSSVIVPPVVVARLSTLNLIWTGGPGPNTFEIPLAPNFIYRGNSNDSIIVDIEVHAASTLNSLNGDDQGVTASPPPAAQTRRALRGSPGAHYDSIDFFDAKVPYFSFEFGGHLGSTGIDGNSRWKTFFYSPIGTNNDIRVTTGGTIDTASSLFAFGLIKCRTMTIDPGATLKIVCSSGPSTISNPCVIRAERAIRIDGVLLADGQPGGKPATAALTGGNGGYGGPGGLSGGNGGAGASTGTGSPGAGGAGFDGVVNTTCGGGGGGGSGDDTGAGGGGSGGFGTAGVSGHTSGSAAGGAGGSTWGSANVISLQGGGGGGGGGGGVSAAGAGGAGGGGGGGYIQIITDRNMYVGPGARIHARGGPGGNALDGKPAGGSGGGCGGAVFLQALNLDFTGAGAVISADGGKGGLASLGDGHGGPQTGAPFSEARALGRIRIDASVTNQSNCSFWPDNASGLLSVNASPGLIGTYLPSGWTSASSYAASKWIDTSCSAPEYGNAQIWFSDQSGTTAVYVNFVGADPDILAQPVSAPAPFYTAGAGPGGSELLPSGTIPATIDLNNGEINGGAGSGGVSPTGVNSLNGYRFIYLILILETNSGTATAQVSQILIQYRY